MKRELRLSERERKDDYNEFWLSLLSMLSCHAFVFHWIMMIEMKKKTTCEWIYQKRNMIDEKFCCFRQISWCLLFRFTLCFFKLYIQKIQDTIPVFSRFICDFCLRWTNTSKVLIILILIEFFYECSNINQKIGLFLVSQYSGFLNF